MINRHQAGKNGCGNKPGFKKQVGQKTDRTTEQQYANDAVFQPPNAPMVVGQANILAWGQAFPPLKDLTFANVTVSGEGNVGYGTSSYDMAFRDMATDQGKQLVVFRRPPGGDWAIVAVSFNSDLPVP